MLSLLTNKRKNYYQSDNNFQEVENFPIVMTYQFDKNYQIDNFRNVFKESAFYLNFKMARNSHLLFCV